MLQASKPDLFKMIYEKQLELERQEVKLIEQQPLVAVADRFLTSKTNLSSDKAAKMLANEEA